MILNIVIFKNKKIDAFTQPQFTDIEPEKTAIQLSRSLQLNEKKEIDDQYKNLNMYFIGQFNDETGEISLNEERRMLLDCSKVIKARNKKDGKEDVESVPINR